MSLQADLEFYKAFMATFGFVALVASIGWRRAVVRAQHALVRDGVPSGELTEVRRGLEELTLELERLGEGQRYLVRAARERVNSEGGPRTP